MKKYLSIISPALIVAVAVSGLCLVVSTNAADESKMSPESKLTASDKKFVKKAYKGGMEEVENGKMAKDKAKDDATKNVAERMITDLTKVNDDLLSIANE
jgi:predicted outer membrane protein